MASPTLLSLKYDKAANTLEVLDQLVIPHDTRYVPVTNSEEAWAVIRKMQVRGAPLIAIVAALGLAVEASKRVGEGLSAAAAEEFLLERMQYLRTSRPTAVNLFKCTDELADLVRSEAKKAKAEKGDGGAAVLKAFVAAAGAMLEADVAANKAIGRHGADAILEHAAKPDGAAGGATGGAPVRVMTVCNTGSLATAGYGTALGVVRALHEQHKLDQVFACETRPYNQGARLTAFEIIADKLPGTLICDSMASAAMRKYKVDSVVVGADRVAANGDTANKIGTYQLAITARHHGASFFVAAPTTSIDPNTACGDDIEIEERPAQELRCTAGVQVAPEAIPAWNPAFDYAPAELITGIVTEHGVIYKNSEGKFDIAAHLRAHAPSEPEAKRQKK